MTIKKRECFYVLVLLTMVITLPEAFAENVDISIPADTSVPGCEETNECFLPPSVTVHPGDTVT